MTQQVQHAVDGVMAITAFATVVQLLPAVAALMSIVWYAVRIYYFMKEKRDGNIGNNNVDT